MAGLYDARICVPCRVRKMKCDGHRPEMCGPCMRSRRILHCTYDPFVYVDIEPRKRAPRGSACNLCRKKKKKCNGARPSCDMCCKAGKEYDCQYGRQLTIDKMRSSIQQIRNIAPAAHMPDVLAPVLRAALPSDGRIDIPSMDLVQIPIPSPPHKMVYTTSSLLVPASIYGIQDDSCTLVQAPTRDQLFADSLIYISNPFALSEVSLGDMDMTFRLIFLNFRLQIGFQFTTAKQQAIICGDVTHSVIHPFFIYFAQLFGCNIYQEQRGEYCYLYTLCIYLRLTRGAFATMNEDDDPLSFAEACQFVSLWCTYNHNALIGEQYFTKAMDVVKRHDIRFVSRSPGNHSQPYTFSCSEPSEEISERIAFLTQLIYHQVYLHLVTGKSEDLCYDLRQQFLKELPLSYPNIYKHWPIFVRIRSVLLGREVPILVASYMSRKFSASVLSSYREWLLLMEFHVDSLVFLLAQYSGDYETSILLQYYSYFCLFMVAEIDEILKTHTIMYLYLTPLLDCQTKCSEIMEKITMATENTANYNDLSFLRECIKKASAFIIMNESLKLDTLALESNKWPHLRPDSVFRNATFMLMGHFQQKLASIRLCSYDGSHSELWV